MSDFPNINEDNQDEICKWVQQGDEVEVLHIVNELIEEAKMANCKHACHFSTPDCKECKNSKIGNSKNSQEKTEDGVECKKCGGLGAYIFTEKKEVEVSEEIKCEVCNV